jgi:hypothetical protein
MEWVEKIMNAGNPSNNAAISNAASHSNMAISNQLAESFG